MSDNSAQLDGTGNGQFSAVANAQRSGTANGPFGSANYKLSRFANGGLPTQHIAQPAPPIFNPQTVYPNFSLPKGPALVISNSQFWPESKLSQLPGAKRDAANVTQLFTNFGYNVHVYQDLTATQMTDHITALSKSPELAQSDSVVIVLSSHGLNNDRLFGVDGNSIYLGNIVPLFNSKNCKAMINKPKLFFIDACRVGEADIGAAPNNFVAESTFPLVPIDADMLISHANTPGFIPWRNEWGSIYINALCTIFSQQAHYSELEHILRFVHAKVYDQLVESDQTATAVLPMPETRTRLRRLFFFSPHQFTQQRAPQLCLPPAQEVEVPRYESGEETDSQGDSDTQQQRRKRSRNHDTTEKNYRCTDCPYETNTKPDLKKHQQRLHPNERPFECATCDFAAATMRLLKQHEQTHSDERPFACRYPPCRKRFKTDGNRDVHENIHKGVSYECEPCKTSFTRPYNYRQHMESLAHSEPMHSCRCGDSFTTKAYEKTPKKWRLPRKH